MDKKMNTDRIIASTLIGLCFASVIAGFVFQRTPKESKEIDTSST